MEQYTNIIRQLYSEVTSKRASDTFLKSRGNRFTPYTVSARPSSLKAFNHFFAAISAALPDYEFNIDNMIVKGDRVMARYTISGIHKGELMGQPPTNERVTITGIDVFRLDEGKVVEHWDAAHQMSVIPPLTPEYALSSNEPRERGDIGTMARRRSVSLRI